MKNIISRLRDVPLKKKLQICTAAVVTIAFAAVLKSYAWFSEQKKAAEMFKVKHPDLLYLNAAHSEDQIYFNLGNIKIYLQDENGNFVDTSGNRLQDGATPVKATNRYVFSVSGSNTSAFTLQLAYTTNNDLEYNIFEATEYEYPKDTPPRDNDDEYNAKIVPSNTNDNDIVSYESNESATPKTYYYVKGNNQVNLTKKNPNSLNNNLALAGSSNKYYSANYGSGNLVHENAVPMYEQGNVTTNTTDEFCRHFILEVTRAEGGENSHYQLDKETDIVYISVEKNNSNS